MAEANSDHKKEYSGKNSERGDLELPPGTSFRGHCDECGRSGEVRMIYHIDVKESELSPVEIDDRRNWEAIGPYDRLCAYEKRYGSVPPYITQPKTSKEFLFRLVTKQELLHKRVLLNLTFLTSLMKHGISLLLVGLSMYFFALVGLHGDAWLLSFLYMILSMFIAFLIPIVYNPGVFKDEDDTQLLLISYLPYYLVMGIVIWGAIAIFPLLVFLVYYFMIIILPVFLYKLMDKQHDPYSFLGMSLRGNNRNDGNRLSVWDHFERVWKGETHLESNSQIHYNYTRRLFNVSLVLSILLAIPHHLLLSQFVPYEILIYYLDVVLVVTLMSWVALFDGAIMRYLVKFMELPSDLQEETIDRYFDVDIEKSELASRKSEGFFSRINLGNNPSVWLLKCQICRTSIRLRKFEMFSQCEDCRSIFHQDHLRIYIDSSDSTPLCPVCKSDITKTETSVVYHKSAEEAENT